MAVQLTNSQNAVVKELKSGKFIWSNEGSKLQAWLGDGKGNKERGILISTLKVLINKKIVKFVDGNYRAGLYKYELR